MIKKIKKTLQEMQVLERYLKTQNDLLKQCMQFYNHQRKSNYEGREQKVARKE